MYRLIQSVIGRLTNRKTKYSQNNELYADKNYQPTGYFRQMFTSHCHRDDLVESQLKERIYQQAEKIDKEQPGYHPIYGLVDEFPAKRHDLLKRDCKYVEQYLNHIKSKHQLRILDVGCNCGYVSFLLAEKFPNVVGLEIAKDRLALCIDIAAYTKSSARFFDHDFVKIMENGDDDLENIDVVLLLNVVHQFIFIYGLAFVQALIARLVSRVDMVFIELARCEQYKSHNKGHLLPENPEDVFADCENVEITLLEDKPRPYYLLRRKKVRLSQLDIDPVSITFSSHINAEISRKYYAGQKQFLKLSRFTDSEPVGVFHNEISALLRMRGTKCAPIIFDWVVTRDYGAVIMQLVPGLRLVQHIYQAAFNSAEIRYKVTSQYLHIAKLVYENIGFHNDMQTHNIIVRNFDDLVLIDYEQASNYPINDPFGLLLWSLFDIWGGRNNDRPAAIKTLRLNNNETLRARKATYPDFSEIELDETISSLIQDAQHHTHWGEFLDYWDKRLKKTV